MNSEFCRALCEGVSAIESDEFFGLSMQYNLNVIEHHNNL